MTRKTTRRTAAQWQSLVAEQRRSGLSMVAFCRRESVPYPSFAAHARRAPSLAAADERIEVEHALPEFVEIGRTSSSSAASGWLVELDLGDGLQLRVRRPG